MRRKVSGQSRYWVKNSRFKPSHLRGTSKKFYKFGNVVFWRKGK